MNVVLASSNPHKYQEFRQMFEGTAVNLLPVSFSLSVDETGTTFEENAFLKAQAWALKSGQYALADDSGLEVRALNWRPGVFSARYADGDANCRKKLLQELQGAKDRFARFVAVLSLCDPKGNPCYLVRGECEGRILLQECGKNGFGYDPLFVPLGATQSFAQMDQQTKDQYSHRGQAVKKLLAQLAK